MKVAVMFQSFSKDMGYIVNLLPKYLSRLGVDAHLITTTLPANFIADEYRTQKSFVDRSEPNATTEEYDGYTLHTLPYHFYGNYVQMNGWFKKLKQIKPDVVQALPATGIIPLNAALAKPIINYKLFTGNHTSASTFSLARRAHPEYSKEWLTNFLTRGINGRLVSLATEKCYCPTEDCAEIAERLLGVQKHKVELMYLGVDTDYFFHIYSNEFAQKRLSLRQKLGFADDEIVCIYTGKMTNTKNPFILAQAIQKLRSMGKKYSALFIGSGVQSSEISRRDFCQVLDFMPFYNLADYYRASDIGVWPTNESTSMLDAAACGIPLIISDGVVYRKPVDGNGLVYKMNNLQSLVESLLSLEEKNYRISLGMVGAKKMKTELSWLNLAKRRLNDYEFALGKY